MRRQLSSRLEGEEDLTLEKALLLASRIEDVACDSAAMGAAAGSLRDTVSGELNSMVRSQELQGVGQVQTRPGERRMGKANVETVGLQLIVAQCAQH